MESKTVQEVPHLLLPSYALTPQSCYLNTVFFHLLIATFVSISVLLNQEYLESHRLSYKNALPVGGHICHVLFTCVISEILCYQ